MRHNTGGERRFNVTDNRHRLGGGPSHIGFHVETYGNVGTAIEQHPLEIEQDCREDRFRSEPTLMDMKDTALAANPDRPVST